MAGDIDLIHLPREYRAPVAAVRRRIGAALALVVFVATVVRLGRDGYTDAAGGEISFLDALYYASVSVTTTGYGDISAVTEGTRLAALLLITPARVLFLILVVGTTVEVLTEQSRVLLAARRWRKTVHDHHLICGFGETGQSVARDLIARGVDVDEIVAIDTDAEALSAAADLGIVGVRGDATRNAVLDQAGVERARAVIVTPNRDDTAVLITLSVREMQPEVRIVAGARERENIHLLEQGGADEVIDVTATVGRLLGLGTQTNAAIHVVDDLLDAGTGLELIEVAPAENADGEVVAPTSCIVVAVIRDGHRLRSNDPAVDALRMSDRLVVLRER